MGIIRIPEEIFQDDDLLGALARFFDTMEQIDMDRYRRTRDFKVTGVGVPNEDRQISVHIYHFDGIAPFVLDVEVE